MAAHHVDPFGYLMAAVQIPREESDWDYRDMRLAVGCVKRLVKYLVEERGLHRNQAVQAAMELFVERRLFQRSARPFVGAPPERDDVVADLADVFDAVEADEGQSSNEVSTVVTVSTVSETSSDDGVEEVPPPAPKRRRVVVDLTGDDS